jgi:HPt (histidine-containing phosphotransfer) domain-containing protein
MDSQQSAVLDSRALSQLLDLDEGGTFLTEVLESYLKDAPAYFAAIERAVAQSDSRALDRAAHTLKSASATLGATLFASLCKEMERLGRDGKAAEAQQSLLQARAELVRVEAALRGELAKVRGGPA